MPPSIVLSNTSPIYYLYQSGLLTILRDIYGEICITEGVVEELKASGDFDVDLNASEYSWIKINSVKEILLSIRELEELGKGESEILSLADSFDNPLLIIDELLIMENSQVK